MRTTAAVYDRLPAGERAHAVILGRSYSDAGAVDLFGPRYGLPHAYSGHNTYWWWGPPILMIAIIFVGLFLLSAGLDRVVSPELGEIPRVFLGCRSLDWSVTAARADGSQPGLTGTVL